VEVRTRRAQLAHEIRSDSGCKDFGIVEVMGLTEERIGEGNREEEDAVDHWAENGTATSFVDAETAWGRGGGIRRVGREE
jgi:hypothetical protein